LTRKKNNLIGSKGLCTLFLKFGDQNVSKFRTKTNFNFTSKLRD